MASFLPDPSSFQDFVDKFLEGKGFYNSWFDHVKEWLSLLQDLNMLFVTYEELHQVGLLPQALQPSPQPLWNILDRPTRSPGAPSGSSASFWGARWGCRRRTSSWATAASPSCARAGRPTTAWCPGRSWTPRAARSCGKVSWGTGRSTSRQSRMRNSTPCTRPR
nr:uncharacterized protein LOC100342351 [Oryctolagus cuniculus]